MAAARALPCENGKQEGERVELPTDFTPWMSLFGGVLIGAASVLLMLLHGRIMGATGILSGFLRKPVTSDWAWRAAVLAGMMSAPLLVWTVSGRWPAIQVPVSPAMLVVGGALVGVGVALGNGCTSGHGVCGLARFSPRSLVATITFMAAAIATVFVIRHVLGGL